MPLPLIPDAKEFLKKYVTNEYQLHHAEMVSAALKAVAEKLEENADKWEILGLVHDWDYDKWPDEHPGRYDQLQGELPGIDIEMIDAIKGHANLEFPRETKLARALLAVDELSGLLYAYMKMVGNYGDMKIKSMRKKLHKDKAFAAKISREDITTGIKELGIPEDELLELVRDTFSKLYDKKG